MMPSPAEPVPPVSFPEARSPGRVSKLLVVAALAIGALLYLWFVRHHTSYLATNSDVSGYFNVARLLKTGDLIQQVPRIEGLASPEWNYFYQQPLGFTVDSERGTMVTTYPVGLPLHLLAAAPFVGLEYAGLAVSIFLAAAAGGLMVVAGRQFGLPWAWALGGVALLWACPLFVFFVIQPMSDVCATVWTLATICAALQTRRHWAWGFAAGAALGIAVLVRPTNLLLAIPVAYVLARNVRAWASLVAAGLPCAAFLAWYNLQIYGSVLTTGYGKVDHLFGLQFASHNTGHFLFWLTVLLSPLVFVPALGLPSLWRRARFEVGLLLLWSAALVGFYVFYFHSGETWWYLRFILPMFPAVILAGLLVTRSSVERLPSIPWRRALPALLLVVALGWEIGTVRHFNITLTKQSERPYLRTALWMQTHAPANAIVLQMQLTGAFTYYTDFTVVRWDLLNADAWERLRRAALAAGRPLYATLFDFEEPRAFPKYLPGEWERLAQINQISVWRLKTPGLPAAVR